MTLSDLSPNERGTIAGFSADGLHLKRFREMGLTKGTPLKVLRFAPLGDPIEISIRGALLSIRKFEAGMIQVEKIDHDKG